ncbi:hypothetical protein STRDD10_01211 [Streptococcus sp. DD10]|uniref:DUF3290 family protein n=1 Tax=Streptococcus sp. DD10 TaxID=1777878 RepID=UPI000798C190|nr:DUF3290 family protein [Streptococcus sp. DD10]KXT74053.1 hypothetical protein STRDD10_01211 [Streptococcus sp. DD10]
MKFYSYDYVLSQISQQNWVMLVTLVILLLITIFFAFKSYKAQKESKYRELVIILGLGILTLVLISIGDYSKNQSSDNQFRTSLHFIELVSEQLGVKREEVYVNTSAATDGAIVKVKDQFYRAISGTDQDTYMLEKMELYRSDVELVEVEK